MLFASFSAFGNSFPPRFAASAAPIRRLCASLLAGIPSPFLHMDKAKDEGAIEREAGKLKGARLCQDLVPEEEAAGKAQKCNSSTYGTGSQRLKALGSPSQH